jgi:hypothetical protein
MFQAELTQMVEHLAEGIRCANGSKEGAYRISAEDFVRNDS